MSFEAEAYFRQGEARGNSVSGEPVRMKYSAYKQRYADCRAVRGSYDEKTRTVEVIIPKGCAKPSGTRGKQYGSFHFWYLQNGETVCVALWAISDETANRRAARIAKKHGLTPCAEPEDARGWNAATRYRHYLATGDDLRLW